MISALIIDDHPLIADGITIMLRGITSVQVTGSCRNAQDALDFLRVTTPDIIFLDLNLPDIDGIQLCEIIRKNNRDSKIIVLTSINETAIIAQLLSKGANGYLLKDMEKEEMISAIHTVLQGKVYLSKDNNEKLLAHFGLLYKAKNQNIVLTRREKEILKLLYDGLTGPGIAERLFVSPHTIESHRKNLLKKLNVNNTQLLLKKALELRLI